MLKKIYMTLIGVVFCITGVYAYQVGDVISEYEDEIFSETDRITVFDVEYLYTFRGTRTRQEIVEKVSENGEWTHLTWKYGSVETKFVIEKAIPLTGNYHILIPIGDLLSAFGQHQWSSYRAGYWDNGN